MDQDVRLLITMGMNQGVRLPPAKSVGHGPGYYDCTVTITQVARMINAVRQPDV